MKIRFLVKTITFCLFLGLIWQGSVFLFFNEKRTLSFSNNKAVFIEDEGFRYQLNSEQDTVAELLESFDFKIKEGDLVYPSPSTKLLSGMVLEIWRESELDIKVDGKEIKHKTFAKTVDEVLFDADISLNRLDKVEPSGYEIVQNGEEIVVTRINVENVTLNKKIDFKVVKKEDKKMKWQTKKIEQAGEKGEKVVEYKITYKDGEEVSRELISTEIVKKPTNEIVRVGTKLDLGKSHRGWGTWYDQGPHPKLRARYPFEGDMFAASPWLPLGSYAKVTNKANGKSVIVRINDRGPFGPNRIIDLHVPAFKRIASLGAGVLEVKVTEIKQ